MKKIFVLLFICILFSCVQPMQEIDLPEIAEDEPIEEIPEDVSEPEIQPRTPEIPEEPQDPEEDEMIIAYFNYDEKLFSYDEKDNLKLIQSDVTNVIRIDKEFFDSSVMDPPALNGGTYDGKIMYQGIDKHIYRYDDGISTKLFHNNRGRNAIFPADGDGIVLEYMFIKPDGVIENASFVGINGGIIYKLVEINNVWNKYIRKSGEWVRVGSSINNLWIEHGQVNCDGVIIHSMGSMLENENLKEPTFDPVTKRYLGGNAFQAYLNPGAERRICSGLGCVDGVAYFLCARDGRIYKYNVASDTITEWVEIVPGTGNNDKVDSYNLFNATAAILSNGFIFYWSGGTIYKLNIVDGVKTEIAESTSLKAWGN